MRKLLQLALILAIPLSGYAEIKDTPIPEFRKVSSAIYKEAADVIDNYQQNTFLRHGEDIIIVKRDSLVLLTPNGEYYRAGYRKGNSIYGDIKIIANKDIVIKKINYQHNRPTADEDIKQFYKLLDDINDRTLPVIQRTKAIDEFAKKFPKASEGRLVQMLRKAVVQDTDVQLQLALIKALVTIKAVNSGIDLTLQLAKTGKNPVIRQTALNAFNQITFKVRFDNIEIPQDFGYVKYKKQLNFVGRNNNHDVVVLRSFTYNRKSHNQRHDKVFLKLIEEVKK